MLPERAVQMYEKYEKQKTDQSAQSEDLFYSLQFN
jgi:hypothetical protein